jgi:hypothetical protein
MIFQLKGYYAEINLLDPPNDEALHGATGRYWAMGEIVGKSW